jgi:serine/threonine-protein kinase RsbW
VLHSLPEEVDAVCLELRSFLQAHGRAADAFAVELLAREALNNAVLHGNQSQPDKTARLDVRLGRRWLRLQITDEGPGFNWRAARRGLPEADTASGRGLLISDLYADRVAFNQRGNQITLWLDKPQHSEKV